MILIKKGQTNEMSVSVSLNKTLSNPYYLFSFTHIQSKNKINFIPKVVLINERYDEFEFVEGQPQDLTLDPPKAYFQYEGQYWVEIYEQTSSGNTDPSLATKMLWDGRGVVEDTAVPDPYYQWESNNEDNANFIFISEDELPSTPTPSVTTTPTTTPTLTPTPSVTPTFTPTPSVTPTETSTPTPTPTLTPSATPLNLEPEYQAILNQALILGFATPGYTQRQKQNQLIVDLKNAGLWTKLSNFYMFKIDTSDGTSPGFTFISWITPTSALCNLLSYFGGVYPTYQNNDGWRFYQNTSLRLGYNIGSGPNAITLTSTGNTEGVYYNQFIGNSTSGTNLIWSTDNNTWNAARYNNTTNQQIFRGIGLTTNFDFTGTGFKSVTINGQPNTDTTLIFRNQGLSTNRTKTGVDVGIAGNFLRLNGQNTNETHQWVCGCWFNGRNLDSTTSVPLLESIITSYMTT